MPAPWLYQDGSLVLTEGQELGEASSPRRPRVKQEGDHRVVVEDPKDGEGQVTQAVVPVCSSFHDPHPPDFKNVSGPRPPDAECESQSLPCHLQDQEGSSLGEGS